MIVCRINYLTGTGLESGWRTIVATDLTRSLKNQLEVIEAGGVQVLLCEIDPRSRTDFNLMVTVELWSDIAHSHSASIRTTVAGLVRAAVLKEPKAKILSALICVTGHPPTQIGFSHRTG